jgi:predicted nucleic acid-binding Zn ribbon protein
VRDEARDEPTAVGDALAVVRTQLGLPRDDIQRTLESRWAEIVGADIAAHAQLLSLRDGVLTIAVDSSPWATQLTYLEAVLVERANTVAGAGSVCDIKVRVRPASSL